MSRKITIDTENNIVLRILIGIFFSPVALIVGLYQLISDLALLVVRAIKSLTSNR